jgi:hypothetical protein
MSTAVIVSGTLRHLVNASGSWQFPYDCDYYLVVDQNMYNTPSHDVVGNSFDNLSADIANCHVKFNTVTVCTQSKLPENIQHHSSINMINKWKLAYYNILPYMAYKNYKRIIILRPDLYLYKKKPLHTLFDIVPEDDCIYSTIGITTDAIRNVPIMNDVLLMVNLPTLAKLGNHFSAYYLENYKETLAGEEIHSMLARFLNKNNISVKDTLTEYFEFAILRDTSRDLFNNGMLYPEYSFSTVREREQQWWQETYGSTNNMR